MRADLVLRLLGHSTLRVDELETRILPPMTAEQLRAGLEVPAARRLLAEQLAGDAAVLERVIACRR